MRFRQLSLLVALLGMASSFPVRAQVTDLTAVHSIVGVLLDPSGAAIAKAQVTLLGEGGNVIARTSTDAVGAFRLDNIAPGKYTLEFHAEGFRDTRVATEVTAKRFSPIRIVMPISVETESVTVATGVNVPIVSTETSENQNANAIDRDALDRVPVFDQDYITTMSRFLDDSATGTNGVTLVVNGIEANGPGVTPSAVQGGEDQQQSLFFPLLAPRPRASGNRDQEWIARLSRFAEFHVSRFGLRRKQCLRAHKTS